MSKIRKFFNDYKEVIIEGVITTAFTIIGSLAITLINNKFDNNVNNK